MRPRHHHPARRFLLEAGSNVRHALADGDQTLDVADARRHAQDDDGLETLGEFEGELRLLVGFRESAGSRMGTWAKRPQKREVLLVLRRGQADVVGHGDHQSAGNAGQRQRHQRIGGDVEADVSSRRRRDPAIAAPKDLQRVFSLTARPLRVEVGIGGDDFQHLGRRVPG